MISRCCADRPARHLLISALLSFFSRLVCGSSDPSSIPAVLSSSNSSSGRRRSAERALKRATANIQVDTEDRPWNRPACRHTSRNTSLIRSSAVDSSRTIRITNRKTLTWWRAYSTCIASRSPFAIRPISTSSDVDCIALGRPTCRLVVGAREWVHGSATVMARHFPQESPASCRRRILPLAIWLFEGMPGRDDKCAIVPRDWEVVRLFQWQRLVYPHRRRGRLSSQERLSE